MLIEDFSTLILTVVSIFDGERGGPSPIVHRDQEFAFTLALVNLSRRRVSCSRTKKDWTGKNKGRKSKRICHEKEIRFWSVEELEGAKE